MNRKPGVYASVIVVLIMFAVAAWAWPQIPAGAQIGALVDQRRAKRVRRQGLGPDRHAVARGWPRRPPDRYSLN